MDEINRKSGNNTKSWGSWFLEPWTEPGPNDVETRIIPAWANGVNDGGTVEIANLRDVVEMGDGFTWRVLTYRKGSVTIVFEVRDGIPGCVSISLSDEDGFIRQKDLAAINLANIRDLVYTTAGVATGVDDDGDVLHASDGHIRKSLVDSRNTRRKMTPDFLRKVADVHQGAREGARISAVRGAFGVKERQALHYIELAKDAGYLE